MRELALFAGAGGGILGGQLLGWRTVCAVEIDPFCREVLRARQVDGCLPWFPIFEDVTHIRFDRSAKILYDDRYYEEGQQEEVSAGSGCNVRERTVDPGSGGLLPDQPAGDVAVVDEPRGEVPEPEAIRTGEPVLQGRKAGKRPRTKSRREGRREGDSPAIKRLRELWSGWPFQGRTHVDPGAPCGLQQAAGGDLALPAVSSRLAQGAQAHRKEVIKSGPDRIARIESIDVISGGFP
jgi:site-specific DNA-cytosine methylase